MNIKTPLISIIMAAKDTARYLPDCLDSIVNQTYQNWELIAVNDHSSDATPSILKSYSEKDNRIRYYDSDTPKLNGTLKFAWQYAQGELINRMDSDDKMPLDKIESMVEEWQRHGKGHVVAGGTEHFVDEGEVGGGFRRYEQWLNNVAKNETHYEEIYKECVIPSHSWMIHRDDFETLGAFNPDVYPEDYDLCFRFYKAGMKVVGMDKVLHFWRDRSERISRTWDCYKDNRYLWLKLKYFYELDRDKSRPLVIWGAGRNGKDMVKQVLEYEKDIHWVCDSENKIGKDIYGIKMQSIESVVQLENPQILILVASPDASIEIRRQLEEWGKLPRKDYWFFL